MSVDRSYYVYVLKDPRTSPALPFYIGKGVGTRSHDHLLPPNKTRKGQRIAAIHFLRVANRCFNRQTLVGKNFKACFCPLNVPSCDPDFHTEIEPHLTMLTRALEYFCICGAARSKPGNASMTPHMLLEELGVPFELKLVDRENNAHKSPEYLKLNPNGLIPVLIDGD